MNLDLGPVGSVRETPGPRTYVVTSGRLTLTALEDGAVTGGPDERHVIMVDEASGQVMIDGGNGVYAYRWPAPNRGPGSLHAFLHSLDFDYFMTKASPTPHRVVDVPATLGTLRGEVLRERRQRDLDGPAARNVWDGLLGLRDDMSEEELVGAIWNDPALYDHYCDGGPTMRMKDATQPRRFWDGPWQIFRRDVLQAHADEERRERAARLAA